MTYLLWYKLSKEWNGPLLLSYVMRVKFLYKFVNFCTNKSAYVYILQTIPVKID